MTFKIKSKSAKLVSLLLALVMILTLFGCDSNKKSSRDKDDDDEDIRYEQQESNNNDVTVNSSPSVNNPSVDRNGLFIRSANGFINGYALLDLGETDGLLDTTHLAVVDTSGNIVGIFEDGDLSISCYDSSFETSMAKRILFKSNTDLVCYDINGNELYRVNGLLNDDSSESGYDSDIEEVYMTRDLSTVLLRSVSSAYESKHTEMAYVDSNGNLVYDWFDLTVDGEKITDNEIRLYYNGYIYTEGSIINLFDKSAVDIDGDNVENYYDSRQIDALNFYLNSNQSEALILSDRYSTESNCLYDIMTDTVVSNIAVTDEMSIRELSYFKNGYAVMDFYGADYERYITLIDRNGQFVFEPIEYESSGDINDMWDGEYLLMYDKNHSEYIVYDASGNEVSEFSYADLMQTGSYNPSLPIGKISDGMIMVRIDISEPTRYSYYRTDGTVLFPDGRISIS